MCEIIVAITLSSLLRNSNSVRVLQCEKDHDKYTIIAIIKSVSIELKCQTRPKHNMPDNELKIKTQKTKAGSLNMSSPEKNAQLNCTKTLTLNKKTDIHQFVRAYHHRLSSSIVHTSISILSSSTSTSTTSNISGNFWFRHLYVCMYSIWPLAIYIAPYKKLKKALNVTTQQI